MKLNYAETPCRRQEIETPARADAVSSSMSSIRRDVVALDRALGLRDFWMILFLWLGSAVQAAANWLIADSFDLLTSLSILVCSVVAAVASVTLSRGRRMSRMDDNTLRSRLGSEIEKLEKQRGLMNGVAYWFLLPMLAGIGLGSLSAYHAQSGTFLPNPLPWAFNIGWVAFYALTLWLLRRATRRKFDPLLEHLRKLMNELLGT